MHNFIKTPDYVRSSGVPDQMYLENPSGHVSSNFFKASASKYPAW